MTCSTDPTQPGDILVADYGPIRPRKSYEEVAARLESQILAGRLAPGTRLPSMAELAKQFGVSVPVVREALMALQARGLLEVRHGSGTYVSEGPAAMLSLPLEIVVPLTSRHLVSLFDIRIPLEVRSAQMAAVHRTDEDLESLQQAVEANRAYRDQGEWKEFFDSDTQFHLAIAAATQNPFLPVMLEPLLGLIMTARESYYEKGLMGRLLPRDVAEVQHNRIIAAIVSQEPEEAGRAMEEHLSTFIRNVEAHERSRRSRPGDPSL